MIPRIPLEPSHRSEFCRVTLSLGSVLKLTSLLGFANGLLTIALALLLSALGVKTFDEMTASKALMLFVCCPVFGTMNGFSLGLFGYPIYKLLMKRRDGQTLKGSFTTLQIAGLNYRANMNPQPNAGGYSPEDGRKTSA